MTDDSARASNLSGNVRASSPNAIPVIAPLRQRKRKREISPVNSTVTTTEAHAAVDYSTTTPVPRGTIPGYPGKNVPLPPSLEDEELIRKFPNHLYGTILLKLNGRGWGAKEIVDAAHCSQLKANTLTKRIQNEKLKRDGVRVARPRKEAQEPSSSTEQSLPSSLSRQLQAPDENLESEAGRLFRMEQIAIRDIALGMKPDMFTRSFRCSKRTAADDRVIVERAAEEYRKKTTQGDETL